jgi:hypothetical protein
MVEHQHIDVEISAVEDTGNPSTHQLRNAGNVGKVVLQRVVRATCV